MDARRRVVIVQRVLLRYRLRFIEVLHAELDARGVALRVVQGNDPARENTSYDHVTTPWSVNVPLRLLDVGPVRVEWQPALRWVRSADLVIVEQANSALLNYVLLARQRFGGPPLAFWGHGRNFAVTSDESPAETLKRAMSRRVHWWFAYTDQGADIVADLGFPRERTTVVRNSSDTRGLVQQISAVTDNDVAALAARLGMSRGNVGVFLGDLRDAKRLEFLIEAGERILHDVPDFELLLVGEGSKAADARRWERRYPWVHYLGPRLGNELGAVLRLATLLLVPGWAGLVIVDSFAAGVPLVASRSGPHPPEIAYLEDGVNGVLVDDDGDPQRYGEAVVQLLRDERRRASLVAGCLASGEHFSAEDMGVRFADGVEKALRVSRPPLWGGTVGRAHTPTGSDLLTM